MNRVWWQAFCGRKADHESGPLSTWYLQLDGVGRPSSDFMRPSHQTTGFITTPFLLLQLAVKMKVNVQNDSPRGPRDSDSDPRTYWEASFLPIFSRDHAEEKRTHGESEYFHFYLSSEVGTIVYAIQNVPEIL